MTMHLTNSIPELSYFKAKQLGRSFKGHSFKRKKLVVPAVKCTTKCNGHENYM